MKFTHLHVHTEYSLLDGSSKISEIVAQAKNLGMDALAITDHGVMYGVIDFYKKAVEAGIKPIIGCEVYVSQGSRFSTESTKENRDNQHLVLLAKNDCGYKNLIKLVSSGFTEGFYYKPRIDVEILKDHSEGLIALSGCIAGVVAKPLRNKGYEKAKEVAITYNKIFGEGNFYLEIQDYGSAEQIEINHDLIRMSKETGIQLVATNDVHYTLKEDAAAHDVLLCIQTAKTVDDPNRLKFDGEEFYLKSPQEMYSLFPYAKEALENTNDIAAKCNLEFAFHEYKLPKFKLPQGVNPNDYLREVCEIGLSKKYKVTDEIKKRLDFEVEVIINMGFADYFLVTWDFIKFAKEQGIVVGPGRGSAAGSIVAYALDITTVDPLKYNLLFERFLNPERISMPDIDIDFCYERRQEVIDYVIQKYGTEHVAQIITFGTMAARGVIRDVGRALNIPYSTVDSIAKMIPRELGISLERALNISPDLKERYRNDDEIKNLLDMSMRLEGLPRHASTHAAGVVITNEKVSDHVPLNQNDGVITTQFDMNTLEELGLLKVDFLGLRTLTVIKNIVEELKRARNIDIDLSQLEYNDSAVYSLISSGKTDGIFQFESSGMKNFIKELKPDCFEDIVAGVALFRPGPMDFIPKYIRGKHGVDVKYTHDVLRPILEATYGCIVYQEQVMQIVRDLAGYSLARSDMVRRAMSKKKTDVMEQERKNFIYGIEGEVPGCVNNGIPAEIANKIFDEMIDFAKYAFNKSHAAAYAVIGYETAYLKHYYPVEFMAALMSSVMDVAVKVAEYIESCKKMGIKVLPPDVNESFGNFAVAGQDIRFGLSAIKNVGRGVIANVIEERAKNGKFSSLTDFANRLKDKDVNKRCMESLIKAGAFDSLGGNRNQYMQIFSGVLEAISKTKRDMIEGQMNLFEMISEDNQSLHTDILPEAKDFDLTYKLSMEKEVLGIYISGHPLSQYEKILAKHITATSKDFVPEEGEEAVEISSATIAGIIGNINRKITKSGAQMAFLSLEDNYGTIEAVIFPQTYQKFGSRLTENAGIIIKGKVDTKEEENAKILADTILFLEDMSQGELWLKISKEKMVQDNDIFNILKSHRGNVPVILYREENKTKYALQKEDFVSISTNLLDELKDLLGDKEVVYKM